MSFFFLQFYFSSFHVATGKGNEGNNRTSSYQEQTIASLLDTSLDHIEIEPKDSYINISRLPNISWQLKCETRDRGFSCLGSAKKLVLFIYQEDEVNGP